MRDPRVLEALHFQPRAGKQRFIGVDLPKEQTDDDHRSEKLGLGVVRRCGKRLVLPVAERRNVERSGNAA
jgi:hypothetical protein